ncbi:hypothetical protein BH18ACI2_BH18ACI2_01280 [soil metagenome]
MMSRRRTQSLFANDETEQLPDSTTSAPLAERMRPRTLEEFVGQPQLIGEGRILRRL